MDTRDVLLVDAFSAEPLAGTPVGVVPEAHGLDPGQRSRLAAELAPAVTAFAGQDGVCTVAERALQGPPIHVAVALASALGARGELDGEAISFDFPSGTVTVEVTDEGAHRVGVDRPDLRPAEVEEAAVARALGIDVAAVRDVAADFPLLRASLGPGVLVVPVNFLEHLSGAEPDRASVGDVLEATGANSLYAFTFDTLDGDRDAHGIEIDGNGSRRPTGRAEACAAAAIARHGALDHDRETLRFEAGDLDDRPARLQVTVGETYDVGGPAVTALDGNIAVPDAHGEDDIIEA
jgi:predicted PhzF superfamily epimerase YddE/YHI9